MTTSNSSLYALLFPLMLIMTIILSGCANKPNTTPENPLQLVTSEQRIQQLKNKQNWRIQGKIAFIQQIKTKNKRESAAISWEVNEKSRTQELNLTSYLGINVLNLISNKEQHLIKIDGKEYRGTNLSELIYSLTELTLPTEALIFWVKGIPFNQDDKVEINEKTQLPISMSSEYNNSSWKINYQNYRPFNQINMATQLTIEKDELLIKISIKNWSFNE
ncbi:lipoprotein insertase outer membrane protein LolB [Colwellia sp. MSW7]|uniref:Outer-membrane lipoprotein LolB n=1 Tax=Colwellia maritima TaxID=2912588 RepID=A0ABS9X1B3_9GAMM|nr:lipoprotein insertase outer membrane protein LolB [Colwellia maritima]MCI2284043.1 lipoprotein insertase outer membrane protein LolB [Colwellia maritima]